MGKLKIDPVKNAKQTRLRDNKTFKNGRWLPRQSLQPNRSANGSVLATPAAGLAGGTAPALALRYACGGPADELYAPGAGVDVTVREMGCVKRTHVKIRCDGKS